MKPDGFAGPDYGGREKNVPAHNGESIRQGGKEMRNRISKTLIAGLFGLALTTWQAAPAMAEHFHTSFHLIKSLKNSMFKLVKIQNRTLLSLQVSAPIDIETTQILIITVCLN